MRLISALAATLLIGFVSGFLMSGVRTTAVAQFTPQSDDPGQALLPDHHKEVTFSLSTGQSLTIAVPKDNFPVRVEFIANGAATNVPIGIKRWFMVYDRSRSITEFLDAGSANAYVIASPQNPSPPPIRIDFSCAELRINLGGTMTITRIPAQAGSDCTNSSDAINYAVSLWY